MNGPLPGEHAADDLNFEMGLDETLVVAAAADSRWARRRKIDLAELINEPWIFGPADTWYRTLIEEIFRARGVGIPKPGVTTLSIFVRARLLVTSPYLSIFAASVVRRLVADHYAVTALPVDLPGSTATRIVTLRNRTLSPVVERFLACVREVAASFAGRRGDLTTRPSERTAKIAILDKMPKPEIATETTRVTASEFQQAFGALSDRARHEPVVISKHGRDSLVVMSAEEWERLKRHERGVGLTTELTGEWVEAVRCAKVPDEFANIDAELK
jgi:prevent-host-death family protein